MKKYYILRDYSVEEKGTRGRGPGEEEREGEDQGEEEEERREERRSWVALRRPKTRHPGGAPRADASKQRPGETRETSKGPRSRSGPWRREEGVTGQEFMIVTSASEGPTSTSNLRGGHPTATATRPRASTPILLQDKDKDIIIQAVTESDFNRFCSLLSAIFIIGGLFVSLLPVSTDASLVSLETVALEPAPIPSRAPTLLVFVSACRGPGRR